MSPDFHIKRVRHYSKFSIGSGEVHLREDGPNRGPVSAVPTHQSLLPPRQDRGVGLQVDPGAAPHGPQPLHRDVGGIAQTQTDQVEHPLLFGTRSSARALRHARTLAGSPAAECGMLRNRFAFYDTDGRVTTGRNSNQRRFVLHAHATTHVHAHTGDEVTSNSPVFLGTDQNFLLLVFLSVC